MSAVSVRRPTHESSSSTSRQSTTASNRARPTSRRRRRTRRRRDGRLTRDPLHLGRHSATLSFTQLGLLELAAKRTLEGAVIGRRRAGLGQLHVGSDGLSEPRVEDPHHALAPYAGDESGQHPDVEETIKRRVEPYFVLAGNVCALLAAEDHVNCFSTTERSFRTPKASSPAGKTTRPREPSPSGRERRSTRGH